MAADWVKMRTDLYRDPRIIAMAEMLGCDSIPRNVTRNATVGALVTLWGVTRHRGHRDGDDLVLPKTSISVIDLIAELPGLGAAMVSVGWLESRAESVVFPRFFEELNTDPAEKLRQQNAERQRRYRERTRNVTDNVTVTSPRNVREEKRREEKRESKRSSVSSHPLLVSVCDEWKAQLGRDANPTDKRATAIRQRSADPVWNERWKEGIKLIKQSPFCNGENDSGWRATIDWFLKPDTLTKLLEGQFAGKNSHSTTKEIYEAL